MGLNTIHNYSEDFMISKNLTNGTNIRGNVLDYINMRRIEAIQGLEYNKINLVIRANGWCDVKVNDMIKTPLFDYPLRVVTVLANHDNKIQFKHRRDSENFTGSSDIYLE